VRCHLYGVSPYLARMKTLTCPSADSGCGVRACGRFHPPAIRPSLLNSHRGRESCAVYRGGEPWTEEGMLA